MEPNKSKAEVVSVKGAQSPGQNSLTLDALHLSIGQALRLLVQAAYFIALARLLGPASYGAFVAAVAMAAVLYPFSGLGSANLFVKNVRTGKRQPAMCWGNGLLLTITSGTLLLLAGLAFSGFFSSKTDLVLLVAVGISDLVFCRVTELASGGFAASGRMKETSIQNVLLSVFRLVAISLLGAINHKVTLRAWTIGYLAASGLGMLYALYRGTRSWGAPRLSFRDMREDCLEGMYFSIGNSATSIYNDLDKVMLANLSDLPSTGIYGAAYRIVDVATTPIRSLAAAAYPRFFDKGKGGMNGTYNYARTLISRSGVYGLAISVFLWICGPLLPATLGSSYAASTEALRWLALIPLLRAIHVFLGDALSGAGLVGTRIVVQVTVALANIGLNEMLLPKWSWRGAAWASLACDGMLVIGFLLAMHWHRQREKKHASVPTYSVRFEQSA